MYLSIQLASSGASTFTTGALRILCCASIFTASAKVASDFISISKHTKHKIQTLNQPKKKKKNHKQHIQNEGKKKLNISIT
jgi:hypothetical protein